MKKAVSVLMALCLVFGLTGCGPVDYFTARQHMKNGEYAPAAAGFAALGDWLDSTERYREARYQQALVLEADGAAEEACAYFEELGNYEDCAVRVRKLRDELFRLHVQGTWLSQELELAPVCRDMMADALAQAGLEALLPFWTLDSLPLRMGLMVQEGKDAALLPERDSQNAALALLTESLSEALYRCSQSAYEAVAEENGMTWEALIAYYQVESLDELFLLDRGCTPAEYLESILPQDALRPLLEVLNCTGDWDTGEDLLLLRQDGGTLGLLYDDGSDTFTLADPLSGYGLDMVFERLS